MYMDSTMSVYARMLQRTCGDIALIFDYVRFISFLTDDMGTCLVKGIKQEVVGLHSLVFFGQGHRQYKGLLLMLPSNSSPLDLSAFNSSNCLTKDF